MHPDSQLLLYSTEDGQTHIQVKLDGETVWLTQKQIAELFHKSIPTINEHIKNVFDEGELSPEATIRNFRIVQMEGTREVERDITFYNLDVVISVGFRVKSPRGTQFRIWATSQLKEFIIKGFVMDDERLKNPRGNDYFEELLERIRDIRTSERRFYQKITDIYATSIDYDKNDALTQEFFATVQNKMHWAIHGHTAPEVIYERADAKKHQMGLTNFPGNKIKKSDVTIAKNYLTQEELIKLNLIADQYLSFADFQARERKAMTMHDWIRKLDDFLKLNERDILQSAGKISHKLAEEKAHQEYSDYKKQQDKDYISDFDRTVKKITGKKDRDETE